MAVKATISRMVTALHTEEAEEGLVSLLLPIAILKWSGGQLEKWAEAEGGVGV